MPLESDTLYNGKPIPPDYCMVGVAWTNPEYEQEELDVPTKEDYIMIGAALDTLVLWNKANLLFKMPTPLSQPSHPSSSPPGDDSGDGDDDDNNNDDNDNASGPSSSP